MMISKVTHRNLLNNAFAYLLLIFTVFLFNLRKVSAQSLIVSVPNTDVTRKGVVMVAHESQLNAWSKDTIYWNSFTFATYGVGHNVEVAMTLYGISHPSSTNIAIALGYKHRIPLMQYSSWEPTLAIGQMIPISLSGTGLGTWTYGLSSVRLPILKTRFTAGISYGTKQIFGATAVSAILGFEQPLTKHMSIVADWFSGVHDLGAFVPGIQFNITHACVLIAGLKIPNSPRAGPFATLLEMTYEF